MRRFAIVMPILALLAGGAGSWVRFLELKYVFEAGLPLRGAMITYALIALVAVFLVVSLVIAQRAGFGHYAPEGFDNSFGTDSLAYPFMFSLFCIVWLAATVKYFIDIDSWYVFPTSGLYFSILSGLAALSMMLFAIEVFQDPRRKTALALSVAPIVFMCFWLILLYKQNASNPILLSYCYYCLAVIFSSLSFYFTAGFVFSKPAPGKAVFSYLASIFFCLVTMADDHALSIKLILGAITAINVVHSYMLIRNLRKKAVVEE